MMIDYEWLDPNDLVPPHEPREDYTELVESMREGGWSGRPLLVVETSDGTLHAWTGTHRIAAAIDVELESIPCYIISEADLIARGHTADEVFLADWERLAVIRKLSDEIAIELMARETRGG